MVFATCPSSKLSAFPKPTSPETVPVSSFQPPEQHTLVNIILFVLKKALTNHVPLGHIFVKLLPIVVAGKEMVKTTVFATIRSFQYLINLRG